MILPSGSSQNHSDPSNWANSLVQTADQHDGTPSANTLVRPLLSESDVNLAFPSPLLFSRDLSQLLEPNVVYKNRRDPPSTQFNCELDATIEGEYHFGLSNGQNAISGPFGSGIRFIQGLARKVSSGYPILESRKLTSPLFSSRTLLGDLGDLGHEFDGPTPSSLLVSHDTFEPIIPMTQHVSPSSQTIRNYSPPSIIDRFGPSNHAYRPREYSCTSTVARVRCTSKSCTKTFGRRADMLRHYAQIHDVSSRKLDCKYAHCHRRGMNGFTRKDKLRDHRRAAHGLME